VDLLALTLLQLDAAAAAIPVLISAPVYT